MKTILSLIILVCFSFGASAQIVKFKSTGSQSSITNSFTNTASDTLDVNVGGIPALVTIKSTVTRATGTMAGKVYVYYSVDPASTRTYVLTDSMTLSNAASNVSYVTKAIAAPYWRLIRNGATTVTGTSAAIISAAR